MTLQELQALIAAVVGASLWWPVGRLFGWWPGLAGLVLGGFVGLIFGWCVTEWISRLRPHTNWVRTTLDISGLVLAGITFVSLPLWLLALLRTR